MRGFLTKAAAQLVLAIIAAAMIFTGVAFVAYAIAIALAPSLGLAGGAAVAGGILLIGPMFWVLVTLISQSSPSMKAESNSVAGILSGLAKNQPLVAVAAAVLVGVADVLLRRRSK